MENKVCTRCDSLKRLVEFPFRNKSKGTYHSYCLSCGRQSVKQHYVKNVQKYVAKADVRRKKVINEINERLYEYLLKHPCVDCGETDPIVLEFDHVRGQKSYNRPLAKIRI